MKRVAFTASAPFHLALAAGALLVSACWSAGVRSIPDTRTPYDALGDAELRTFADARAEFDAARFDSARGVFARLVAEHPDSIVAGTWLQECEVALATSAAPNTPAPDGASALDVLRAHYAARAEESPSAANCVLAARLAESEENARKFLDRAAELDPACVWVPYARAFLAAKNSSWDEVRRQLDRARAADPGHMPTRWLECWMLARAGRTDEAQTSLETWIEKARGDVRVDGKLVLEARIDLALVRVLDGDARGAQSLLDELEREGRGGARERLVEAAAEESLGDRERALAAAQAAAELAPKELLPVVQQALLYELWLNDPAAAEAAWTNVLALSKSSPELSSMLERVRARVYLERHEARRERSAPVRRP